jgi:LPS export ABC transporter protein LptC
LVLLGVLAGCSIGDDTEAEQLDTKEAPDIVFYNFTREEVENGRVVFTAKAEKAEHYQDRGILVIDKMQFEMRGKDSDKPIAAGEADKAIYHEDSGDVEFQDYVRVRSLEEDASFEAKQLRYNAASETIEGAMDDPVIARVGADLVFYGSGFFADLEARAFSFRNSVQGTLLGK